MILANETNDMFMIQNGLVRANGNWKVKGVDYDYSKKVEVENTEVRVSEESFSTTIAGISDVLMILADMKRHKRKSVDA